MFWGITTPSTSLWILGSWNQKYGANPLVRYFWAHKEKMTGNNQHGFTTAKLHLTNSAACYDKMSRLVQP